MKTEDKKQKAITMREQERDFQKMGFTRKQARDVVARMIDPFHAIKKKKR